MYLSQLLVYKNDRLQVMADLDGYHSGVGCKYVPLLKIAKVANEVFEIPFLYANHKQWLSIRNG